MSLTGPFFFPPPCGSWVCLLLPPFVCFSFFFCVDREEEKCLLPPSPLSKNPPPTPPSKNLSLPIPAVSLLKSEVGGREEFWLDKERRCWGEAEKGEEREEKLSRGAGEREGGREEDVRRRLRLSRKQETTILMVNLVGFLFLFLEVASLHPKKSPTIFSVEKDCFLAHRAKISRNWHGVNSQRWTLKMTYLRPRK